MTEMLTKGRKSALEKVWAAEVEGRLPFPSNARIYLKLRDEGLVEPMETVHRDRFGSMTFRGWQLTHAGRFLYCASCEEDAP